MSSHAPRRSFAARAIRPPIVPTQLPVDLDGRVLVLVDDVLFTGRELSRCALMRFLLLAVPAQIQYAVLVDRATPRASPSGPTMSEKPADCPRGKIRVRFENHDHVPDSVSVVEAPAS